MIDEVLKIIENYFEILKILKNNMTINIDYHVDDDYDCEKFENIELYIDDSNKEEFNKIKEWLENDK